MKQLLILCMLFAYSALFGQSTITYAEYFTDIDPGFGNGVAFAGFNNSDEIEASANILNLDPGIHEVCFRALNSQGVWSQTQCQTFYIFPRNQVANINYVEWFWDNDPGFGQVPLGNRIMVNPDSEIEVSIPIGLNNIPLGIHDLSIRARDADGIWSQTLTRKTFIRAERTVINKINYTYTDSNGDTAEFTFDLFQPKALIDVSFNANTSSLTEGQIYELCLEVEDTEGNVSGKRCQTIEWKMVVNTNEEDSNAQIQVFPNPNQGQFSIQLPESRPEDSFLRIVNATGQELWAQEIEGTTGNTIEVDLPNAASGVYFALFELGSSIHVQKIQISD